MKNSKTINQVKALSLVILVSTMAGCTTNGNLNPVNNIVDATINFNAEGCPIDGTVNTDMITVGKPGQKIRFTSDPLMTGNKVNEFQITFDPFVGRPYKSKRDGTLTTKPLSKFSPPSTPSTGQFKFKYTIYSEGCPAVDPMIIIDR